MYALTKEEGGRHTPFTTKYKPQFFIRTADVAGACAWCVPLCSCCPPHTRTQPAIAPLVLPPRLRVPQPQCLTHAATSAARPPPGQITLPEGTTMVMPGDNFRATIDLSAPVALEVSGPPPACVGPQSRNCVKGH